MRIACLQFAPQVADVDNNLNRADAVLNDVAPEDLDLLVLPELAFSGYNFKSLGHITPFLEITNSGISSLWARTTALKHDCTVVVGYPEKVDPTLNWPTDPEYYNSAIVVNGDGETVANYRKSHLYYTDETWALEGSHGFFQGRLPGLGRTALGICMDLNPYKFQAPWDRFEFAQHALDSGARLVIVSMAWITNDDPQTFNNIPQEPDSDTILYWVSRLEPIIRIESNEEVFVVFANRCGTEGSATYAGTSAVVGIRSGEVWVYGILGRGETDLLVVDTDDPPYAKLVYRPNKASVGLENPETPEAAEDAYVEATERDQSSSEDGEKPPVASPSAAVTNKADNLNLMPSLQGIKHVFGEKHSKRLENAHYENQDDEQFKRKSMASGMETDSLRPRIAIPSEQFMLQRYLESESPTTRYHTLHSKTLQNLHGSPAHREPTAVTKTPHRQTEIAKAHPSPLRTTESEQHWDSSYDTDDMIISETDSQIRSNENRYSLRSDVSVWNNQHGRPRSVAVPITAPPQLPSRSARPATSAVDQSARASARTKEGSGSKNQQQMYGTYGGTPRRTADFDLPILKPASQSQLLNRRGSDAEKGVQRLPLSHSTVQAGQVRPSTVPNGPNTDRNDIGRGRRRSAQPQSRERRRRPNSGQAASTQPIDLSQFRLIEEYPSANCPIHGSRPPSGTRRRTESGARGRTDSQSRPLAENDRGRRQHSHGTQQSSSRKTQSVSKHSAQRARDVPQPNRPSSSRPAAASSRADLITETILSSSHVPLTNSGAEPRTPVAMLLIQDSLTTMENTDRVLSPLKCVERDAAHVISRPLSSIW